MRVLILRELRVAREFFVDSPGRLSENASPREGPMEQKHRKTGISLDWWTVIVAFALTALVIAGALPIIPW